MTRQDRTEAYGVAALSGLLSDLAEAEEGERNSMLNRAAYRAGRLVAAGALDGENATREIEARALALGLARHEVSSTIRSGLRAGMASPANIPGGEPGYPSQGPARPPLVCTVPTAPWGPPPRPPRAEVERLWHLSGPVTEDPEVGAWLAGRAIPPDRVELHDLARAIPPGARLPRWAGCRRVLWSAYHRLVTRGWGATGAVESLHARAVGEPPVGLPKGLWPAAGPGSARGLVLADGLGCQILKTGRPPKGWGGELVVAEGVPDFLSWTTTCPVADESAPAILGVASGSWTSDLAARVPDGTRVVIATHHDGAGHRYAQTIAGTLAGRCEVRRWEG